MRQTLNQGLISGAKLGLLIFSKLAAFRIWAENAALSVLRCVLLTLCICCVLHLSPWQLPSSQSLSVEPSVPLDSPFPATFTFNQCPILQLLSHFLSVLTITMPAIAQLHLIWVIWHLLTVVFPPSSSHSCKLACTWLSENSPPLCQRHLARHPSLHNGLKLNSKAE